MEIKICLPRVNPEVGIFESYCRILDSRLLVLLGNIIDKLLAGAATKLILLCLNSMIPIPLPVSVSPSCPSCGASSSSQWARIQSATTSDCHRMSSSSRSLSSAFAKLDCSSRIMRPTQLNPLQKCILAAQLSSAQLSASQTIVSNGDLITKPEWSVAQINKTTNQSHETRHPEL